MTTTDIRPVVMDIQSGALDEQLPQLEAALKERRAYLIRQFALRLEPGDTVHFSDAIRPRYLVGKAATVKQVNEKSVSVNCPEDPSYQKYAGSRGVRCPNELIEELS